MNVLRLSFLFLCFSLNIGARPNSPKLIVGIVVDQMRADYLDRFYNQFSENGFKRLLKEGFSCRNTHINYIPTITGPGHASIFSGTSPRYHGIIGNEWYDRSSRKSIYCIEDSSETLVGTGSAKYGVSPRNLLSTNLGDQIKMSSGQNAKVISLSLKDRAAVLPAGHMADGAFWLDLTSGNFVSSSYYMKTLPTWIAQFNQKQRADFYLNQTWDLLLPSDQYPTSLHDDNKYEWIPTGKEKPIFPYNLKELSNKNGTTYNMVYKSPFGNSLLTDLAIDALQNANLGKSSYPDLLTISFSSTDAVGHAFGPLSMEVNDTYYRLDHDLARLLDALDKYIGKDNYTLFLTADHGVDEIPQYLIDHKTPAGYLNFKDISTLISTKLSSELGKGDWIESVAGEQIYLNHKLILESGKNIEQIQKLIVSHLQEIPGIAHAFTATQLEENEYTQNLNFLLQNGFYENRCGDVKYIMEPGWTDEMETASTHGTGYTYDTNIPLLWFGKGINKGESIIHHNVTDIVPTASMLIHIRVPSACTGEPITEVLQP